jgi:5-methylcytosine-specific restriction endonuclease McrA
MARDACECGKDKDRRAARCRSCASKFLTPLQWEKHRDRMIAALSASALRSRKRICVDCGKYRPSEPGVQRCRSCWLAYRKSINTGASPDAQRRAKRAYKARQREKHLAENPPDRCRKCGAVRPPRTRCPECNRAKENRRRARKAAAAGSHTITEWLLIVSRQHGRCAQCRQKAKLTRDHIVPIARGGSDFAFNIQGLCRSCNSAKRDRLAPGVQPTLFDRVA